MEQEAEGPVIVVDQERPAVTIAFSMRKKFFPICGKY